MTKLYMNSKKAQLDVYSECKYTASAETLENCKTVNYDGVFGFEIVTGEKAKQIEAETDGSCIDDFHEYLVLLFDDGETSTYRNSYVDLFIY